MAAATSSLRARTNGFTVTPRQYAIVAYAALGALALIVLSGAAVRLTGSGLGCPEWPRCYGRVYPPLNSHAIIEFSNRMITVPVSIVAIAAWALALRRRPYRRDLTQIALALPIGVAAQAVLGGLTVRGALDYGWVMGHFALSMLILVAAVVLAWRATHEPEARTAQTRASVGREDAAQTRTAVDPRDVAQTRAATAPDRLLVRAVWALVALGALTIFAGTAATAAGPHAGGSPGQRINRLAFDGRGTMDFVIHRHSEIAFVFSLLALGVWWLAQRRSTDATLRNTTTALCVLLAVQGGVGLIQYETHLPTELVWVHVSLACASWIAVLWAACAVGAPRAYEAPERESSSPAVSLLAATTLEKGVR